MSNWQPCYGRKPSEVDWRNNGVCVYIHTYCSMRFCIEGKQRNETHIHRCVCVDTLVILFCIFLYLVCPHFIQGILDKYTHRLLLLLLLLLLSLQSCPTLCNPIDGSPPGSPVPGILQARTSGLPFPSPMHESEKWKWSRSAVSDSSWPHGLQPTSSSIHGTFQTQTSDV